MHTDQRVPILVVDDSQDNLDLICEILEHEPFRIITAQHAEAALRLAQEHQPLVMVLDVQLPDVDGFELCQRLRATCGPPEAPVVFVTARYTHSSDVVHGLESGGCDYITKPVNADELRARIRACVRACMTQRAEIDTAKRISRRMAQRGALR
jgi:DNA-binding response OmpR family regulator